MHLVDVEYFYCTNCEQKDNCENVKCDVKDMPVVDAVVVVRCKDCVHWDDDLDTYGADYVPKGKCMKSFKTMHADDFCSYGDQKDGR